MDIYIINYNFLTWTFFIFTVDFKKLLSSAQCATFVDGSARAVVFVF